MSFLEQVSRDRRRQVQEDRRQVSPGVLREAIARAEKPRPLPRLQPAPLELENRKDGFARREPAVIAEIKRRSPSRGLLRPDLDVAEQALAYQRGGAAAVSVLTEPCHFGGSFTDLETVAGRVSLPVLCKDFVVDPYQLLQARAAGADLVLLMVAVLGPKTSEYVPLAREVGLEPLVEVHDEQELETACASGTRLVGLNNRDLHSLRVDLEVSRRLLPLVPPDRVTVVESGIRTPGDVADLQQRGADLFLVGEALLTVSRPEWALRALREGGPA
jgi:indole-3-glycerol phosphate synthase